MIFLFCLILCFSPITISLNIEDFGGVSDDSSYEAAILNGEALLKCFLLANSGNDRTVLIEKGKNYTVLPAGDASNLVNVTFVIDGILNAWNGDQNYWPNNKDGQALPLISLTNTQGLVIKGNGLIEGNGYLWWWVVILTGKDNRPNLLEISNAKDTLIDGITFKNSPRYHINLIDALNLTAQNLIIYVDLNDKNHSILDLIPTFPLNTDGIDIRGKNIYFRNLTIQNFDDAVAVKPTHNYQSIYSNCTENILVEDCFVKYGVGMSIGSVPPNSNFNCVKNVTFRNIKFENPLKAIYIKPNPGNSGRGVISDILYENIEINQALWWAIYMGTQQQHQPGGGADTKCSFFFPLPGTECLANPLVTIKDVTLRNINIHGGLLSPGIFMCNQTNPCTNLVLDNVNVYNRSEFPVKEGYFCENFTGYSKNSNLVPSCLKDLSNINNNNV